MAFMVKEHGGGSFRITKVPTPVWMPLRNYLIHVYNIARRTVKTKAVVILAVLLPMFLLTYSWILIEITAHVAVGLIGDLRPYLHNCWHQK